MTPVAAMHEVLERFDIQGSDARCRVIDQSNHNWPAIFKGTREECETYRLERAYEAARAAEWQPIETAPRDGKEFLTICTWQGNVAQLIRWDRFHNCWMSKADVVFSMQATHWQPLPPAPGTEEK